MNKEFATEFIQSSEVLAAFSSCDIKSVSVNAQVFQTDSNYKYVSLKSQIPV